MRRADKVWRANWLVWGVFLILFGTGCRSQGEGGSDSAGRQRTSIDVDGSSTVYPVSALMAEDFETEHTGAKVAVAQSGTGGGFKKFGAGEIDICGASRPIKESEIEICRQHDVEYVEFTVAIDGLAIVGAKANTWCTCLTVDQLKRLWEPGSEVRQWRDLDPSFPAEDIKLYGPGVDSGTFDYFTEVIVKKAKSSRTDYSPSEDDNVIVTGVSGNPHALGYFGFAYYEANKDKLRLIGVDSGNGCVEPSVETILNGTYQPLSRPLFIYVNRSSLKEPGMLEFVRFYLEHAVQSAREVGYVPVSNDVHQANLKSLEAAIAAP